MIYKYLDKGTGRLKSMKCCCFLAEHSMSKRSLCIPASWGPLWAAGNSGPTSNKNTPRPAYGLPFAASHRCRAPVQGHFCIFWEFQESLWAWRVKSDQPGDQPTQNISKKISQNVDAISAIAGMSSVKRCEAPWNSSFHPFASTKRETSSGPAVVVHWIDPKPGQHDLSKMLKFKSLKHFQSYLRKICRSSSSAVSRYVLQCYHIAYSWRVAYRVATLRSFRGIR